MRSTPDAAGDLGFGRPQERGADVALALEVLGGGERHLGHGLAAEDRLGAVLRVLHPVVEAVELGQRVGHPGGAGLGDDVGQVGVALEHAGEHEVPEGSLGPPLDLEHEHRQRCREVVAEARRRPAGVVVERQAARRPPLPRSVRRLPSRAARTVSRAVRPGTRMPPRRPCSAAHSISSTDPSTSPRKIWMIPARRSGASLTKSASQRLWARRPAQRCSKLSL